MGRGVREPQSRRDGLRALLGDRLFVHFAIAFWLLALNQLASSIPLVADETRGYEYLLRVLGFIVIIVGIIDKNLATKSRP